MQPRFAALESRVNAAVLDHLANAVATLAGGAQVPVIFDVPHMDAFDDQMDAAAPECTGPAAALGGLERGDSLSIRGQAYRVQRAEPDGTGMVRLLLYSVHPSAPGGGHAAP